MTARAPACASPWGAAIRPGRWTRSSKPSAPAWRTCAGSRCMPELPIAVAVGQALPAANSHPIAVAMSGGVDSSTVAAMLVRQGRTVVGMTMQLWNQRRLPELASEGGAPSGSGRCCSLDDVYDARRVAEQIGIPYYVVNFERQFEEHVVKPFVEEYLAGRTPSPAPCATTTSSSIASWRWPIRWARTTWPPATTRACASTPPRDAINCCARWTVPRIRPTFSLA